MKLILKDKKLSDQLDKPKIRCVETGEVFDTCQEVKDKYGSDEDITNCNIEARECKGLHFEPDNKDV